MLRECRAMNKGSARCVVVGCFDLGKIQTYSEEADIDCWMFESDGREDKR